MDVKNETLHGHFVAAHRSPESVFTYIYRNNVWRDPESVSGRGSSLAATETLRELIAAFFTEQKIKSVVDLPCGDFNWFKELQYQFERYVGYDIVTDLVNRNQALYGSPDRKFVQTDLTKGDISTADIAVCRDFLIHISNEDIFAFFNNLRRSTVPGILTSHYRNCVNTDIPTGNRYRPIDFTQPPFSFPEPVALIPENITSMRDTADRHAAQKNAPLEKYLAFWKTRDIYAALDTNTLK